MSAAQPAGTSRGLSFGSVAERYEQYRPGYDGEVVDLLLADGPASAIEVGAGTGKATVAVASRGVRVTAVEPDPEMAAVLERRVAGLPVNIVVATLETLGEHPPVDLLFAAAAWHWTDPATRWDDAARLLVPGGTFAAFGGPITLADGALAAEVDQLEAAWFGRDQRWWAGSGTVPWPAPDLAESRHFADVRRHELLPVSPMPAAEYLGVLSTVSAYLALDEASRAALLARVADLLPDPVDVRRDLRLQLARRVGNEAR